jgi:hypothetical protein
MIELEGLDPDDASGIRIHQWHSNTGV